MNAMKISTRMNYELRITVYGERLNGDFYLSVASGTRMGT
jgi:hypothetical protein